ncbi:cellulose synthase operon protein YhjQ [Enterobacterales bacterium CwR94]|nr:cellulose synthase operon protein YhjQ [Enterobacterales bacterium CwR94]
MPVIALQGLRGGAGTTSLTAALSWALNALGERVLAIDFNASNHLGLQFNLPLTEARGWMRAQQEDQDWQQSAMRYLPGLDFLPYGQQRHAAPPQSAVINIGEWAGRLDRLKKQYAWILLDLTADDTQMAALASRTLRVMTADANSHLRLHQQRFRENTLFLLNQYSATSKLQQDIHQLWLSQLTSLIPLMVHRDEAVAEAMMMKQPLGEVMPHSLAADEVMTLANWLLLNVQEAA